MYNLKKYYIKFRGSKHILYKNALFIESSPVRKSRRVKKKEFKIKKITKSRNYEFKKNVITR